MRAETTMNEMNRSSAVVTMHMNDSQNTPDQRTFICLGVPRGGTSAVAGTMQRLGVFMGSGLTNNYEDADFLGRGVKQMAESARQRDGAHDVWGWKCPDAVNYLDELLPHVRNPHLIVVFRDIVATMKAHMRWHNRNQQRSVHEVLIQQQRNWFLVERWKLPTALISYEKAITKPNVFVHHLADFMTLPRPADDTIGAFAEFLRPGSYK